MPQPLSVALFSNQFASSMGHGLARYARELFDGLRDRPGLEVFPVAAWSNRSAHALARLRADSGLEIVATGRRATPLMWSFIGWPRLEALIRRPIDVVHATSLGYPVATGRPFVVTVHDLGPITKPQYFSNTRPWVMKKSLAQAVRQAAAIVCVSEATKAELLECVGTRVEERVHVVHEGITPALLLHGGDVARSPATGDLPPSGVPYVLATGKISPRKNIAGLMEAMATLTSEVPHHLVVAGGDGWDFEGIYRTVDRLGLKGRIHFPGFVTDTELSALYAGASLYVHPSLYEGFGLTILEAMAVGTPVVTSNVSALPEVAGDAALLVDPGDIAAIAEAMRSVLLDDALSADLVARGLTRAATFSWQTAAEAMEAVYRTAIVSSGR